MSVKCNQAITLILVFVRSGTFSFPFTKNTPNILKTHTVLNGDYFYEHYFFTTETGNIDIES